MSNVLVAYFSRTGNTKAVAEAIHEGLSDENTIASISELEGRDLREFDIIFLGFPVHSHSIPYPAETFLRALPGGVKTALFSTHGALTGSRLSREALEYASTVAARLSLLGTFSCRGKVSSQALEVLQKSPEHAAWAEMSISARTHPDESDLEDARAFARWIMTLAAQP